MKRVFGAARLLGPYSVTVLRDERVRVCFVRPLLVDSPCLVGKAFGVCGSPMAGKQENRPSWIRWSGIGVEFAAAVAGLTLVGYWIDHHFGSRPWGTLIGALLGLVGGMYNLIRSSLAAARELEHRSAVQRDEES